jgi:hypothetical protein
MGRRPVLGLAQQRVLGSRRKIEEKKDIDRQIRLVRAWYKTKGYGALSVVRFKTDPTAGGHLPRLT